MSELILEKFERNLNKGSMSITDFLKAIPERLSVQQIVNIFTYIRHSGNIIDYEMVKFGAKAYGIICFGSYDDGRYCNLLITKNISTDNEEEITIKLDIENLDINKVTDESAKSEEKEERTSTNNETFFNDEDKA